MNDLLIQANKVFLFIFNFKQDYNFKIIKNYIALGKLEFGSEN